MQYLHPWNQLDAFKPVPATLALLYCMWFEVLDRVAGQQYASCLRDIYAERKKMKD